MRFHCPKCDTKYRITEDKLAERPAAKMRCKECTAVFSVQDAIAAEGQRASEASTPGLEVPGQEQYQPSRLPSVPPPAASLAGLQPRPVVPARGAANPLARSGLPTKPIGTRPSDRPVGLAGAPNPLAPSVLAQALGPKAPVVGGAGAAPLRTAGQAVGIGLAAPVAPAGANTGLGTPRLGSPPLSGASASPLAAKSDAIKPLGLAAPAPKPLASSNLGLGPRPTPLGKPGLPGTGLIGAKAPFGRGPVGETVTALVPEPAPKREATLAVASVGAKSEAASGPPGPVLGRGSASAFPPVTAERTLPVVPPFHPAPAPSDSSLAASALPSEVSELPRSETIPSAAATQSKPPTDSGVTPRVPNSVTDAVPSPLSAGPWASNVNAPSAPPPGLDAGGVSAGADPTLTAKTKESPVVTPRDVGQARDDLSFEQDYEFSATRRRPGARVVSLAVAAAVSVVFGAGGFASGYLVGVSNPAAPSAIAAATSGSEVGATSAALSAPAPRDSGMVSRGAAPPPPPPPALEAASAATSELAAKPMEENKLKKTSERKTEEVVAAGPESQPATSSNSNVNSGSLSGLGMALGPGPVAGSGNAGASSGAGLEAAAIQSTVQKNQNAVKRSCWQPALNGRAADAPSTARVTTTIQISPGGTVTSVKHSGDPRGYPGLGGCIVARLKGWTFPKSNGSTTANIPFVFAAQ